MASVSECVISREPVIMLTPDQCASLLRSGRKPVFLVRHGQTDWNQEKRLQGREDIPLNDCGVKQSERCGELFKRASAAGLEIDMVYSSPLVRSMETARIISENVGCGSPRLESLLVERDYGELSGMTPEERHNEMMSGRRRHGAESKYHAGKRMMRAVASIASRTQRSAVAVTHGGALGALFSVITSDRVGTGKNLSENCGVSIVASGRHDVIPVAFNIGEDEVIRFAEAIADV